MPRDAEKLPPDKLFAAGHAGRRAAIRLLGKKKSIGAPHLKLIDFLAALYETGVPVLHRPDFQKIGEELEIGKGKVWRTRNVLVALRIVLFDDTPGAGWIALNPNTESWDVRNKAVTDRVDGLVSQLELQFDTLTLSSPERPLIPAILEIELREAFRRLERTARRRKNHVQDGRNNPAPDNQDGRNPDSRTTILDVNRVQDGRETVHSNVSNEVTVFKTVPISNGTPRRGRGKPDWESWQELSMSKWSADKRYWWEEAEKLAITTNPRYRNLWIKKFNETHEELLGEVIGIVKADAHGNARVENPGAYTIDLLDRAMGRKEAKGELPPPSEAPASVAALIPAMRRAVDDGNS